MQQPDRIPTADDVEAAYRRAKAAYLATLARYVGALPQPEDADPLFDAIAADTATW
jgi:hypothetical protein